METDNSYNPAAVEKAAQAYWQTQRSFEVTEDPNREKFYCLAMFPYPSGKLHMGHVRNYTIGDVIARYQRMQGKNVLQPMGWDAFGLPAENAAHKHGVAPAKWTTENIAHMREQLKRLGFAYDWSRELATCTPEYYRWEQWFFTQLYARDLVYKKTSVVNWDPVDCTVLANEQVIDGRGWRSGALVERREIPQWFVRITAYAEELLAGLDDLEGWPEAVRTMQRNWIGRSVGVHMCFAVADSKQTLDIYTTRPDTLMGVSYMAVAAEHPLAKEAAKDNAELSEFLAACQRGGTSEAERETMEKRGMSLGIEAIHPASGEHVPIWVANFVLMGYGTGAVMAVPAHDQRDWEFAQKYQLPVQQVIFPMDDTPVDLSEKAYVGKGFLGNSGAFDGLDSSKAFEAIADWLEQTGKGKKQVQYRLRDWGISRQRYWGCPIPMIETASGESQPVPDAELPVRLPEEIDLRETGGSPLRQVPEFYNLADGAHRETDTFDTFFESSWYFARYCCHDNDSAMLDERANHWLPVDQYVGGVEHAVMHLLYARFFHKLMRDVGLVNSDEPFTRLLTQGMVVAETFYREAPGSKRVYYAPHEVDVSLDTKGRVLSAKLKADGEAVTVGKIEKMSKSRSNGVDPGRLIARYGADTVRLFTMFAAPPEQSLEWSDSSVEGGFRFLKRFWKQVTTHAASVSPTGKKDEATWRTLRRDVHKTIAKVSQDIGQRYAFNTAIAANMELLNKLNRFQVNSADDHSLRQEALEAMILMLSPVVPHICHRLWEVLGKSGAVIDQSWPVVDAQALETAEIELVVQVNGKKRAQILVPTEADKAEVERLALADPQVQRFIEGKTLRKVIVVPGRLVSLVV